MVLSCNGIYFWYHPYLETSADPGGNYYHPCSRQCISIHFPSSGHFRYLFRRYVIPLIPFSILWIAYAINELVDHP